MTKFLAKITAAIAAVTLVTFGAIATMAIAAPSS